ncbi:zinc finger protein 185-like isoform X2 [Sardina pilchardus]|uniref:zinc finger protein 185-like isoform X2 n=1 Tax=Sardina pilchardus TaxID=27697 RepID=UPI002E11A05A
MSKDERTSVMRTTKVRTALKGDCSWIQRRKDPEPEEEEEKPWMAEVRANRLNGAPIETSPVSSPTTKAPASTDTTESTKSPASGYLIRGVFKKTDTKPASSTNGISTPAPTSTFTKKPSEAYKKIAPHTVRSSTEPTVQTEPQLSPEEVEKRTEAASGVLQNTKAARQRSYVLSAAKKYEVEISDDETDTPEEPVSAPPAPAYPAPVLPAPTPVKRVPAPEPTPPRPTLPARVKKESPPEVVTPEPVPQESVPEPPAEQSAETLSALSDTLLSFNTEDTSPKKKQEATPVVDLISSPVKERVTHTKPVLLEETKTVETSVDPEPIPEPSSDLHNDDLVDLAQSGDVEQVDTPPSSPPAFSHDLLTGPESFPVQTKKTTGTLDLLADDIIPIDTKRTSLSDTDDLLSPTETVTITTKTTVITEDSDDETDPKTTTTKTVTTTVVEDNSVDPFDPFPKVTTPIKSPVELFDPLVLNTKTSSTDPVAPPSPIPDDSMPTDALVDLADDIIPIDTNTTRLITNRNWERFDTQTQDTTPESEEEEDEPASSDDLVPVRYERKSTDNDSPWDRWTSPTVDATKTEESPVDADQESTSSDSEAKKGIVLFKEYVDDKSDYSTTRSTPYDYDRASNMSACTYCGELVGSDAKITIEHLNISCHPSCFKCAICSRPMGDLLFSMFLHNGMVHCESCYANVI